MVISAFLLTLLIGAGAAAIIFIAYLTFKHIKDWFQAKTEGLSKETIKNMRGVIVNSKDDDELVLGIIDKRDDEIVAAQKVQFKKLDKETRDRLEGKKYVKYKLKS